MTTPDFEQQARPTRPRRAFEIDIHIGGDGWNDVLSDLRYLVEHVQDHGPKCSSVMGGPSSGHTVTVTETPEMTHEKYIADLEAYLDRTR